MFLIKKIQEIKNLVLTKWAKFKKAEVIISLWITIISLVILYSYFLSSNENTRDAERYVDLLKINDELKIYHSKNKTYPLPDDSVNITANGEILTYQWNAWEKVFEALWIVPINDPKKSKLFNYLNYYTYTTDETKQKFQLMAFYEWNNEEKYKPTSDRIPYNYWDKIGIAIESNTSRPIQETKLWVDVLTSLDSYSIYSDNENILTWDKQNLKLFVSKLPISTAISCLEIKNAWWNENWFYYINPMANDTLNSNKSKSLKVYCDMESDWGGWTRIYYKKWKNTCFNDENIYSKAIIEKIFSRDFAVSDKTDSIKSEWSWILKNIEFSDVQYDSQKMSNVANCKTPAWTQWDMTYDQWYVSLKGTLSTLGSWQKMFSWCEFYKNIWEEHVVFNIWWMNQYWMTWEFIHTLCNNYSAKDNSITSRWDWENTRTIWVR